MKIQKIKAVHLAFACLITGPVIFFGGLPITGLIMMTIGFVMFVWSTSIEDQRK